MFTVRFLSVRRSTDTRTHSLLPAADKDKVLQRQRRGSIIILGMLAIAKRSVVTEKLDLLLGIGLGKLGKVSILALRPGLRELNFYRLT